MLMEGSQLKTALNSAASHFEDANRSILQFCGDMGRQVNKISLNVEAVRMDALTLNQQANDITLSLNTCKAQGESYDNSLGHLERRLTEVEQDNKILLQQVENLKAKQAIDQSSLQELKEKVEDKLNHLVHPVTLTAPIYSYTDKTQVGGQ